MIKGVLAVVVSSLAYGVMPVFTKNVLGSGLPAQSTVFFRMFFACIIVACIMLFKKISFRVSRKQFFDLCLYGILGFGMTALLLASSYKYMPIGIATMLHFAYPLFVTVFMNTIFREKNTVLKVLSVAFAVMGLFLMTDLSGGMSLTGVILALLSGVTYAVYVIANKKSSMSELNTFTSIFYVTLLSSTFFALQGLVTGQLMLPQGLSVYANLVVISLVCTVFALSMLMLGIKILGATNASVLNMIEPLTSVFCGIYIFGESQSIVQMVGCGLIVCAALCVAKDAKETQKT